LQLSLPRCHWPPSKVSVCLFEAGVKELAKLREGEREASGQGDAEHARFLEVFSARRNLVKRELVLLQLNNPLDVVLQDFDQLVVCVDDVHQLAAAQVCLRVVLHQLVLLICQPEKVSRVLAGSSRLL
jgi:hypothetical protein